MGITERRVLILAMFAVGLYWIGRDTLRGETQQQKEELPAFQDQLKDRILPLAVTIPFFITTLLVTVITIGGE